MTAAGYSNLIALFAAIFTLGGVTVALIVYIRTEARERRIEKANAYLELEMHSSEAFRYQVEKADIMRPLRQAHQPVVSLAPDDEAWETTQNYYFQCLNLFEVCANFRRQGVVKPEVFASWLAWYEDILEDWYFQSIWWSELRCNYTRDVRDIFDIGVGIFARETDPALRQREFYEAVAHVMGDCPVIRTWLDDLTVTRRWPPREDLGAGQRRGKEYIPTPAAEPSRPPARPIAPVIRWNDPSDQAEAAQFAARVISQSTDYISHGEIQSGLSPDGAEWAPDLAALYASDFANSDDRDLLVARTDDGSIIAIAVLAWEQTPRRSFAVLEDMAVESAARSAGVGSHVMAAVDQRVRDRGVEWTFLESGVRNRRAHLFFQRHGFVEVSHVFARRSQVSTD